MRWPNAQQDIAVTKLTIFLPSLSLLLSIYDCNDAALDSDYKKELLDL